jgi:hypothetical protein
MNTLRLARTRSCFPLRLLFFALTLVGASSAWAAGPAFLHTMTPCRLYDSRDTANPIQANQPARTIQVTGACGVPAQATGVAFNVTTTQVTGDGWLFLYPGPAIPPVPVPPALEGGGFPFRQGHTRAKVDIVELATDGSIQVKACNEAQLSACTGSGQVLDVILDINGYFMPPQNKPAAPSGGPFSLAENSANGTVVGTVAANDPDVGDTHTFSIVSGNVGGAFAINPTTGQITVADSTAHGDDRRQPDRRQ